MEQGRCCPPQIKTVQQGLFESSISDCSLGCDLNLVYELTIFQIPRVSDLFGNQQLTSTGRR